ncbi:hypothetical protein LARV_00906 [Longilinea arvoryzae]|uniref:Uncharacterized protein n=1 Tax=Longilinea arvoryzae TaxID=360412 RepID=A0A0S7BF36_9CHLR|nr:hypothetical protein [Longilinea arvoryzae]GAP13155.1 hypothetical protein LARV_00906 [Longilinea arvoryzae]
MINKNRPLECGRPGIAFTNLQVLAAGSKVKRLLSDIEKVCFQYRELRFQRQEGLEEPRGSDNSHSRRARRPVGKKAARLRAEMIREYAESGIRSSKTHTVLRKKLIQQLMTNIHIQG